MSFCLFVLLTTCVYLCMNECKLNFFFLNLSSNRYMGYQFTRGANVAYSLYGSKTGFGGCSKSTFINSFYTLDGLTTFVQSVGLSLSDIYTQGYYNGGEGGGGGDNNTEGGCTSALMCGEDKKQSNYFIQASFTDGTCHPSGYSETTDTLSSLNSALSKESCAKISSDTAYTLLTYSQTCTALSGGQCPDPHSILAECEAKYVEFDQYTLNEGKDDSKPYRYIFGSLFYLVAFGIAGYTYLLMKKKQQEKSVDDGYSSHRDTYEPPLAQPYAPSRQLSIQSVAHSVAESVKSVAQSVKDAIQAPSEDDAQEPLGTSSSQESKTKRRGPFALLRRGRNKK